MGSFLGVIRDNCPGLDNIDLIYEGPDELEDLQKLALSERVDLYKKRVYGIIHGGYSILQVKKLLIFNV